MYIRLLAIFFILTYYAYGAPADCPSSECLHGNSIVLRTAAFFPVDSLFRKIYGNVVPCYEIEFVQELNRRWMVWENADFFSKKGRSFPFHNPTRISVLNFSSGIKYQWEPYQCLRLYLGAGVSLGASWIRDKLQAGPYKHTQKFIVGGVLKSDLYYYFVKNWFINLFADYLYQPYRFYKRVDFGGAKVGGGIGYTF